ncbi:hypothetical protein [Halostella pelagica]|uniref:hypothetical protein n=1 Tax=Halostella pelagica TaxID=2583824 RepID=UPI001081B1A8|nr:hypothetical protein [Halostella pelagica]
MSDNGPSSSSYSGLTKRRYMLAAGGLLTGVAGCSQIQNENTEPETDTTKIASPEETTPPEISWQEQWVEGEQYSLSVDVDLKDAEKLRFETQNSEDVVAEFSRSDGRTHSTKIAGRETAYGFISMETMVEALVPREGPNMSVDLYRVSSDQTPPVATHVIKLNGSVSPDLKQSSQTQREFTQTAHGIRTNFTLQVPDVLYQYYKDRERNPNYGSYVSDRFDDRYIKSLASEFEEYGEQNNLSDREVVDHAIAFVQDLEYTKDKVSTGYDEYPKYPVETLYDKGGDCEDTCILLSSLLDQMGYATVLLVLRNENHMALGVAGDESIEGSYYDHDGRQYYYVETTAPGWNVGELPPDIEDDRAQIESVDAYPSLVFSWSMTPEIGKAKAEIQILNAGKAPARNVESQVELELPNGNIVTSGRSSSVNIAPRESKTVTTTLYPPEKRLRARVGVLIDGQAHDYHETEIVEPIERDDL